jgi:uridine phosphorylase
VIRAPLVYDIPVDELQEIEIDGFQFINLEMESSAIYLLADILGHKAISFNDILSQRFYGKFSGKSDKSIEVLIHAVLKWVTSIES